MENIKFYLVTFLLIVGAGFLGYGAIASLRDPVYYVNNQALATIGDMKSDDQNPDNVPDQEVPMITSPEPTPEPTPTQEPEPTPEPVSKNADLIARLEKIPTGTVLKNGSKGDQVKAVQEALNIVNNAKLPTTGTFGDQTEAAVRAFQKSANISPQSGQVASKTLSALIDKLK